MKNFILFSAFVMLLGSCKKEPSADITKFNWVLTSATASTEITMGNRTSSDLKVVFGEGSCYSDLIYAFLSNGTYMLSSTGSLCDLAATNGNQQWTKKGNNVTLTNGANEQSLTINGDTMTETSMITINGQTAVITTIYTAKRK